MASEIFIDASVWIALIDKSDQSHARVSTYYPQLAVRWPIWVTTNLVVAETYRLIRYRNSYEDAARFLRLTRSGSKLIKVYSNEEIDERAEEILHKYRDQDFIY